MKHISRTEMEHICFRHAFSVNQKYKLFRSDHATWQQAVCQGQLNKSTQNNKQPLIHIRKSIQKNMWQTLKNNRIPAFRDT